MPWEQIENSTIRIEEAAPSSAPLAHQREHPCWVVNPFLPRSATTQPESVSDHLASPAPAPDLTEPSESIFAAEPSTIPAVLPEPEVPTPSAADSSSTVPFSWSTVFDGAWKFAAGTLSSSSPAAVSKPDAISQDARDLESVQPESVPDPELSAPSITSTPEPPVSFSDPEPLPSVHPSILSEVSEMNRLQKQMRSESPICHSLPQFFFRKNPCGQRSHQLFRALLQAPSRWTFRCRLCQSRSNPLVNLNQFRSRLLWSRSPWRHFRKSPFRSLHVQR